LLSEWGRLGAHPGLADGGRLVLCAQAGIGALPGSGVDVLIALRGEVNYEELFQAILDQAAKSLAAARTLLEQAYQNISQQLLQCPCHENLLLDIYAELFIIIINNVINILLRSLI